MFIVFRVVFIGIVFFLSGCANVKILSATAIQSSNENLIIEIQTNKKIERFENSSFAHHVYLKYMISNTELRKDIENPSKYWEFPFSSTDYEASQCKGGGICYKWKIPMKLETSLSGVSYSYKLKPLDKITIKIGGGTMALTQLKSNSKIIIVP